MCKLLLYGSGVRANLLASCRGLDSAEKDDNLTELWHTTLCW
jgi:hypothetical protein